jgi:hypothetical protein
MGQEINSLCDGCYEGLVSPRISTHFLNKLSCYRFSRMFQHLHFRAGGQQTPPPPALGDLGTPGVSVAGDLLT